MNSFFEAQIYDLFIEVIFIEPLFSVFFQQMSFHIAENTVGRPTASKQGM
jgi:hypothetical protein